MSLVPALSWRPCPERRFACAFLCQLLKPAIHDPQLSARPSAGCTRKRTQRSGRGGAGGGRHKLQRLDAGSGRAEASTEQAQGSQAARTGGPPLERPRSRERCTRDSSRLGAWTPEEKQGLLDLVAETEPCGAADWEVRPPPHYSQYSAHGG